MLSYVHMRDKNPSNCYKFAKDYYKGAQTAAFDVSTPELIRNFVDTTLSDPKAVVFRNCFKKHDNSVTLVLSMHAIDLDVKDTDKDALKDWMIQHPEATVQEIIDAFPNFALCFEEALSLQKAAADRGKVVYIVSTGLKGFRLVMVNADSELYAIASTGHIEKTLLEAKFKEFFGIDHPEKTIDLSIYRMMGGVRTGFFPHPATAGYPRIITDASSQYTSLTKDPETHALMRAFWIKCIENVPQIPDDVVVEREVPQTQKRKRNTNDVEPEKEDNTKLDDIRIMLLEKHGYVAQHSSLSRVDMNNKYAHVIIDKTKSKPFYCPIAERVHKSNTFRVQVDLEKEEIVGTFCMDPECNTKDKPEPDGVQDEVPEFLTILRDEDGKLNNHVRIAKAIQKDARQKLAFEVKTSTWRMYNSTTGCWEVAHTSDCLNIISDIINDKITQLANFSTEKDKLITKKASRVAGGERVLGQLCKILTSYVKVDEEGWTSHFSGYLPVRNMLLQFCLESGKIVGHPYRPDHYIRAEYQCKFVEWDPTLESHGPLEQLLTSWWEHSEKVAWTEFIAYALSRTAFTEKLVVAYGPPGAAKSSVVKLLTQWFGASNIFTHASSSFIVQNNPKAKAMDDDGNGHNTLLVTCFDKAVVVFPEPLDGGIFRDSQIKIMTGDIQSGRIAHSGVIKSVPRTFTPMLLCNFIPKPKNGKDIAVKSRIELLTMHRVFYRNEDHKKDLQSKMSDEQIAGAQMVPANTGVVDKVINDPNAATAFLNILAKAWFSLVYENNRVFRPSIQAQRIISSYWSDVVEEEDSVVAFMKQNVIINEKEDWALPRQNLWFAYGAWHRWCCLTEESPGPLEPNEANFKVRVSAFLGARPTNIVQRRVHLYQVTLTNDLPIRLTRTKSKGVRCYTGMALKDCPEAYETIKNDDLNQALPSPSL